MEWQNGKCYVGRQSVNSRLCKSKQPDPKWSDIHKKQVEIQATPRDQYCPKCSAFIGQLENRPAGTDRSQGKESHSCVLSHTQPRVVKRADK